MLGYVASQWWTVATRHSFEAKMNRLELDVLKRKIDALDKKAEAAPEVA